MTGETRKHTRNKKKNYKKSIGGLTILMSIVFIAFLKMYQTFSIDLLMRDIHSLEQQKKQLVNQTEQLQAEVDRLSNIDRVSRLAAEKYHLMNNTDPIQVLQLKDSRRLNGIQQKFAERFEKKKDSFNLAGVH